MGKSGDAGEVAMHSRPGLLFRTAKRTMDVVASICALAVLALPMILIAMAIKLTSRGPVFFRQERIGYHRQPFRIFKFRTMVADAERQGRETAGRSDPRITRFGGMLRKTKLDELPQFFNVLLGNMSLVGPRPEIPFYALRYQGEELQVFSMRPGITDACSLELADLDDRMDQRGGLTPAEYYEQHIFPLKKKLQLHSVRNLSLWSDLTVLWATAWRVLRRALWR